MIYLRVDRSPTDIPDPGLSQVSLLVDTSSLNWPVSGTLRLPVSPTSKARVLIKDISGQADSKPIVILGRGLSIDGESSFTLQNPFEALLLVYTGTQWVVI